MTELTSHVVEFPFQKLQYVQKNTIYFSCIDAKCDDKDYAIQVMKKLNSLILNYRGAREEV